MLNIKSIDLELTQKCNLDCPYCYLGKLKTKGVISEETLLQTIELIKKNKVRKITFYGGEPFLAFDKVIFFVEECKRQKVKLSWSLLSNGTIAIDEQIKYCRENSISVQRSLDGCQEAMDICRGKGTLEKYNKATLKWQDYSKTRRTTILPETAKYIMKSLHYFQELGFKKGFGLQPDYYSEWKDEHIKDFKDQLWEMAKEYVDDYRKTNNGFYCFWLDRPKDCLTKHKKQIGCGAGRSLHCVTWDGYLVLCHRFASESRDSECCAGHISEILAGKEKGYGPKIQEDLITVAKNIRNSKCLRCFAKYGCGGGCYHVNYKSTGSIIKPHELSCVFYKEATKIVKWMDEELRDQNPEWYNSNRNAKRTPKEKAVSKNIMTPQTSKNCSCSGETTCNNCPLYDRALSACSVIFIKNNEEQVLQTSPNDKCHLIKHDLIKDIKVRKQEAK